MGPQEEDPMSHPVYGARHLGRALTGLDFGLRVRIDTQPAQRTIFSGALNLSVQVLTSELAQLIASLRVYSYALRAELEEVTGALQLNVESGSWRYARRAALDLAGLLGQAQRRRLARGPLAARGANAALRVAELCGREGR
jgi:hypothetical protein